MCSLELEKIAFNNVRWLKPYRWQLESAARAGRRKNSYLFLRLFMTRSPFIGLSFRLLICTLTRELSPYLAPALAATPDPSLLGAEPSQPATIARHTSYCSIVRGFGSSVCYSFYIRMRQQRSDTAITDACLLTNVVAVAMVHCGSMPS